MVSIELTDVSLSFPVLTGGSRSLKWLYRSTRGLRFHRPLSRKTVRFEERGFRRWLASRGK